MPKLVVGAQLGHASVRTTLDVYGRVLPEVDDRVTAGLGDLVAGSPGRTVIIVCRRFWSFLDLSRPSRGPCAHRR